jgi:outer membrane biosynthesis protein TonB
VNVLARSRSSVDRPFAGRSAAALLGLMVALIALAIGATGARASEDVQVAEQSSATTQSAPATSTPADGGSPSAAAEQPYQPTVEEPAEPIAPPAETEAPTTPAPPEPPETQTPAEQPPPPTEATTAEPSEATVAEPSTSEPAAPEPAEPEPEPAEPSASATAHNQSEVWQAIFQVQQGCRSNCQGTSQSQSATQVAETIQSATAIGGGTGSPSNATALNESTTGQFIWQVQLGCVAFCYGTSQSQAASQWAQTTQNATALADGNAQAHNVGSVMQEIWQLQFGCEVECHGTSQTQSSTQGQSTNQSATATSETWGAWTSGNAESLLPAWLVALAQNLGITIQTVWQYQEAACLENCVGDSQAQEAAQRALTSQLARAVAGVPPPEPPAPTVEQPPAAAAPPVASSAGAQSSGGPDKTFLDHVTATWRRASTDGKGQARVRQRASVSATSGSTRPGAGATDTKVELSSRVETGSSSVQATTNTRTTTSSGKTQSGSPGAPTLGALAEPASGESGTNWLLLGLLACSMMVLGVAIGRKVGARRPAM